MHIFKIKIQISQIACYRIMLEILAICYSNTEHMITNFHGAATVEMYSMQIVTTKVRQVGPQFVRELR